MRKDTYKFLDLNLIEPNKEQPRTHFEEEKIQELAESIQKNGLLQPIVVRPIGFRKYQIVVGERRYRACKLSGIKEIPVIIQKLNDQETANAALVENIQRENLSAIEEALAYQQILDAQNITQSELAKQMGKKQSTIANKLRLLQLPITIQEAVKERKITERHARALLKLSNTAEQNNMLRNIEANDLTVEETEKRIKAMLEPKAPKPKKGKTKAFSRNVKIVLNTFKQAIDMAEKTVGSDINSEQTETDDEVILTIHIKK